MGQSLPNGDERDQPGLQSNAREPVSSEGTEQTVFDPGQDIPTVATSRTVNADGDPKATVECNGPEETQLADADQTPPDGQLTWVSPDAEPTTDESRNSESTNAVPSCVDVADAESTIETDIEQAIADQWQNTFTDESIPRLTIKSDPHQTTTESFEFSLKPREVNREGQVLVDNPDYVRQGLLGEGGIGEVYSARQKSIDRQVAIKVLKKRAARRESSRDAFVAEAMITGELDHPNIVPVYDLGLEDEKTPFYVMKQVHGDEWADRMRSNSLRENLDILMRVADAIALAHARDIIHRDLKPANVMLGEFGEVLVMDWGLAVPAPDSPRRGAFPKARFGGTPCYMAPEMASGPVDQVDRRSDIYLLGAILFEVLTGSAPHPQKTVKECLRAAAANDIAPTDQTGLLMDLAGKAMATAADDRYQTVADFQAAVREYFTYLESISLAEHGQVSLEKARLSDEYDHYSRTVFEFEKSYEMWPGNAAAKAGLSAARLAFAESALRKNDHDLCGSVLDMDDPTHTELRLKLFEKVSEKHRLDAAHRDRLRRQRAMIRALVAFSAALLVFAVFGALSLAEAETSRFQEHIRSNVLHRLSSTRAQIESSLNRLVYLTLGLNADVILDPDLNQDEFASRARMLVHKSTAIRSVQLARNSVISHVYPLEGNEEAVGLNLLEVPQQRDAVLHTIATGGTCLVGPVNLVQGGAGFICRTPIFLTDSDGRPDSSKYWGLTTLVIDRDQLIAEFQIPTQEHGLNIVIRDQDALGADGHVFLGDEDVLQQQPEFLDITLPTGSWHIAAVPADGWPGAPPVARWLQIGSVVAALLAGWLIYLVIYMRGKNHRLPELVPAPMRIA